MTRFTYHIIRALAYAISLLPFRLLYLLSDVIFIFVYYVAGYRRRIVRRNLAASFPDKSRQELRTIERRFYRWLGDYAVETIKLLSISDEALLRHIEFRGIEQLEQCFDRGQNCAAILGHYCNWEWLSATGLGFKRHPQAVMGLIYHPLYNKAFDQLFIDLRSAHGGVCVPKKDILRFLVAYRRDDRRSLFGYISDQAPWWTNIHLWLDFLHQETPVFTGGERIMRRMNDAVFYVDMERPRRGRYVCTFRLVSAEAAKEDEFAITRRFYKLLEESIRRQPAFYLWTHNRWKRTRAEFERIYDVIDGKIIRKEEPK